MDDQGEAIHLGAFILWACGKWGIKVEEARYCWVAPKRAQTTNSLGEACKFYVNIINDNILHCSTTLGGDLKKKKRRSSCSEGKPRQDISFCPRLCHNQFKIFHAFHVANKFSLNVTTSRAQEKKNVLSSKKSNKMNELKCRRRGWEIWWKGLAATDLNTFFLRLFLIDFFFWANTTHSKNNCRRRQQKNEAT